MSAAGRVLRSAAAYFAVVFCAGFILGIIRTLWLAPRVGATLAVAVELPILLAVSIIVADRLMRRFAVRGRREPLFMGGCAFVLLMLAEFTFAAGLAGTSPATYAASMATPAGALGLFGQILFALIPTALATRAARQ
ncbi:hypothetical protein SAMN02745157_0044 [Kaistia soli DSM 19436]|uniref:Uncharacterized protein n=1 Tax=Kaistia soli DSM 19436 TaxID=1122133 RepID=A0A1M5NYA1_9HYPH|nr:hypothetical protein [Kaistia soli]SHG94544.1 hypothetical protein SAMN02745157_0044 [Kaistia soli DSM 19436]